MGALHPERMDAHLRLKSKASVIGSASDFAYKWSLNVGLSEREATRLALAADEVITDVVLHAFPDEECEFEVVFRSDLDTVEVVVRELGEPFDPDRHRYDRERAVASGDFHGAGIELVHRLVDDFVFLNKGKAGKEFRLVKRVDGGESPEIIAVSRPRAQPVFADDPPGSYTLHNATPDDAEDISKLIFRTYGYTYANEDMYHPKRIELGYQRGEKFGVITRSQRGEATGCFAVLRVSDSAIGEVAEVAVSPEHRRKGLMTRMLGALVERARDEGLRGLFGEAVAVHDISQRVNHKFGFRSTAVTLAAFPITRYRRLVETFPEDMSAVIEFVLFDAVTPRAVYLPLKYKEILKRIYRALGVDVEQLRATRFDPAPRTQLDIDIAYHNNNAVVVVRRFGRDFEDSIDHTTKSLDDRGINAIYVDLPLDNPCVDRGVSVLEARSYLFAGLMPIFHRERDYLRMQRIRPELDLGLVATYSPLAAEIKKRIQSEMKWITRKQAIT